MPLTYIAAVSAIMTTAGLASAAEPTYLDKFIAKLINGKRQPSSSAATSGAAVTKMDGELAAAPSTAQAQAIRTMLAAKQSDARVAQDITEAAPLIEKLVVLVACGKSDRALNAINAESLEPQTYRSWSMQTLIGRSKYHDNSQCFDLSRLGDWSKPANNALSVSAWFVSPSSGEAGKQTFVLQKVADRGWLVRSIGYTSS